MMLTVFSQVPKHMWIILCYVIAIGFKNLSTYTVSLKRLSLIPFVFHLWLFVSGETSSLFIFKFLAFAGGAVLGHFLISLKEEKNRPLLRMSLHLLCIATIFLILLSQVTAEATLLAFLPSCLGIVLGYLFTSTVSVSVENKKLLTIPGSFFTFVYALAIFVLQYAIKLFYILHLEVNHPTVVYLLESLALGVASLFIGRIFKYFYFLRKSSQLLTT